MDGIRLISESAFEHFMSTALLGIHGMIVIPDAWDQNGQLLKVRYPDLHLTRPQLRVTLDTGSFIDITDEEVEVRNWLVEMGQVQHNHERDIDLQVTISRRKRNVEWAAGIARLDIQEANRNFRWRYLYERSLQDDWEHAKAAEDPSAEALDLFLHKELRRHLFVTCNKGFYNATMLSRYNPDTFVLDPMEARQYIDLYLKAFGVYRIRPNSRANRGLYYWLRLWNLLPAFQSAWPYAVIGRDTLSGGKDIMEFMQALYIRIIGQMQAHDRIAWLRYSPATNDTLDEMLNQLNYFIVLATGTFDSLAWLTSHRFGIQENRRRITLRAEHQPGSATSFFQQLAVHVPHIATFLRDTERQAKIALFYGPRDNVQHRLVLTGAHFRTGQYLSDCNVVHLSCEDATAITAVAKEDSENFPFSDWGSLIFAEDEKTILEPYRFTRAALKFELSLVNKMLELLDLSSWIEAQPDLKTEADAIIAIGQGRSRNNYGFSSNNLAFAVPYP